MDGPRQDPSATHPRLHRPGFALLRQARHGRLGGKSLTLDALLRGGRKVPELNDDSVREVPLYSYRIIYQIHPDHIDVLAVIHKRRDLKPGGI
jgi:plasmid stabilization system protein ParE